MNHIKRILCPTTLCDDSDLALRYAVALARAYEAELDLCYCAVVSPWSDVAVSPVLPHLEVEGLFDQSLAPYLRPGTDDKLQWQGVVTGGSDPAASIVRESLARDSDLIVMCSRRRPWSAALLGSVAESVCGSAPCPVLVTHPDQRQWADDEGKISLQRILVAYDFSDYAELAWQAGLHLARQYQAELHLLHVLPPTRRQEPELAWSKAQESPYHKTARRLQRTLPQETAPFHGKLVTAVREGPPYREILKYAENYAADLLCLGAHQANFGTKTLFGSNVDRIVRQAGCSVLVARPRCASL